MDFIADGLERGLVQDSRPQRVVAPRGLGRMIRVAGIWLSAVMVASAQSGGTAVQSPPSTPPSGQGTASAPTAGRTAVLDVLAQYSIDPLAAVPTSGKPIPADGRWSVSVERPAACPQDATSCVGVIYTVSAPAVVCQWLVVPSSGATPARFLDENDAASRYLLRTLPAAELAPLLLTSPQPKYPAIAQAAHVAGTVVVRVVVTGTGTVRSATVVSGPAMLRANALDAAQRWTFRPLFVGSRASSFASEVTATFQMAGRNSSDGTVVMRP